MPMHTKCILKSFSTSSQFDVSLTRNFEYTRRYIKKKQYTMLYLKPYFEEKANVSFTK